VILKAKEVMKNLRIENVKILESYSMGFRDIEIF